MGKKIFGLIAVACLLTAAGCGVGRAPEDLCNELLNCPGAEEEVSAEFAEACPLAMMALQFAFPDCYQCLSDNVCDALTACENQCSSITMALPTPSDLPGS